MKELALIIPVYNEGSIISTVVKDWCLELRRLNIDFEVRVYNDGSKDNTLDILQSLKVDYKELVIRDKANSGHGPSILLGYQEAQSEYIFQVDSDNEMSPDHFEKLWSQRSNADLIIASRKYGYDVPLPRKVVSKIAKSVVSSCIGNGIEDVNAPYRLMRRNAFESIYNSIPKDTFAPNLLVSGMATKKGLDIRNIEVPSNFRTTGEVSIQKWKLFKVAVKSLVQTVKFALNN